ncbi:MAG TPA: SCO family protein [Thermoleophilaceae bacterium]|jgi:cytochrome oxidase Cu insertion factor (SCO1/SenC/PrrC family)/thiol-disulfide isomerase/thioredoxin
MLNSREGKAALALLIFALALVIGAAIVSELSASAGPNAQSGTLRGGGLAVGSPLDRPVPSLRLVDDRGKATSLASFRGRYLLLAPSMTLCHEVCPMTSAALEQIQSTIERDGLAGDVTVAEVSVDPWRDTPARLREYQRMTGVRFRLLTGSRAELSRLWKFFGVYFKRVPQDKPPDRDWLTGKAETFDVQHTDGFFVIDPAGRWRVAAIGMPSVGGDLARPLRRLLNDQGRDNLQNPRAPWTPKQALADLFELKGHDDAADASSSRRAPAPHAAVVPKGLVGGVSAFRSRLAELRGHPVVVNEWASWCLPCRNEFPLFARASIRYGKRVAFLGLNVSDNAGNAATFLRSHPVSYPSYTDVKGAIAASLGSAQALPTTVFFAANGHRVFSHIGYYRAAEALDSDIERYALGQ